MSITKLVIDRAKWGSGALLRADGRMCCLGHLCVQSGIPESSLISYDESAGKKVVRYGLPDMIKGEERNLLPDWAKDYNLGNPKTGPWTSSMIDGWIPGINDSSRLSWEEKESKLITIFASKGIELSFVGSGYQPVAEFIIE